MISWIFQVVFLSANYFVGFAINYTKVRKVDFSEKVLPINLEFGKRALFDLQSTNLKEFCAEFCFR